MANFIQPSFSSGEITPSAYGRVDLAKYLTGLKTCRNFITRVHGGAVNRPGTEFISMARDHAVQGRFIPFIFNENQAYILDFEAESMQVIKDGGTVLEANKTISTMANLPPVQLGVTAHGYVDGDQVFITGTGIPEIDNRFWFISNVSINAFRLVGTPALGMFTVATGTVARAFTLVTPYTEAMLPYLNYTQLRDVMTIALNAVRPKDLSRSDHAAWSLVDMAFEQGPFQEINVDVAKTIQASAATGTVTLTAVGHTPFTAEHVGMLFYLEQKDYGQPWEVGKSVTLGDIRRSEGKYYENISGTALAGTLRPNNESDNWHDGEINWKYIHSGFGIVRVTAFTDTMHVDALVLSTLPATVVSAATYKWAFGAWGGDQGWPAAVTYFQQRRTLASTPEKPEFIWLSGTNAYAFFGRSSPIVDDDSITIRLVGNQVNAVRHMLQLGKLIVLTAGGKWVLPDDDNNPILSPAHKSARQQGSVGTSLVPPAVVEDSVLYTVEKGQTIQDLAYQFVNNSFAGKDLSVLSKHLFEGHTITSSAYQHVPFQVLWFTRDDGMLISMTYLREHEVWGFHRHDTFGGFFENVAVIPEGTEDRVYFRVRRFINGQWVRYRERLASRLYTDIKDAFFVDSGLTYDGRNIGAITMTITGGPPWDAETYTLIASGDYFEEGHVGDEIHFPFGDSGYVYRFPILSRNSPTSVVIGAGSHTIPADLQALPFLEWGHAKSVLTGLWHLEAETVAVLADGHVHPRVVVTDGGITLQNAAVVVTAGLPIEADLETLNLNNPSPGSLLDREKCFFAVRLMVEASRGIKAGPDANHLDEYAQREGEGYDEPVDLATGLVFIRVDSRWEPGGRVFIRTSDPLPLSIIGIMPDLDIGGAR